VIESIGKPREYAQRRNPSNKLKKRQDSRSETRTARITFNTKKIMNFQKITTKRSPW